MRSTTIVQGLLAQTAFVYLIVFCQNTLAEEVITQAGRYSVESKNIRVGKLSEQHLKVLGVTIAKDSLESVQEKLGPASLLFRREGGAQKICYVAKRNSRTTYVTYEAGPLGGYQTLTGFTISLRPPLGLNGSKCAQLTFPPEQVVTDAGLGIRTQRSKILELLGSPSFVRKNVLLYVFELKEKDQKKTKEGYDDYTINSVVEVALDGGRAMSLTFTKTESY